MITILTTLLILTSFILAIFIYIQQGKGDLGIGSLGGGSQLLFGGSGGQDFLQKTTWALGSVFMLLSLALAILKTTHTDTYLKHFRAPIQSKPLKETTKASTASKK